METTATQLFLKTKHIKARILNLVNNERIAYVDNLGQKVADSDVNKSKTPESFATLQSFNNAINGQSGSIVDTVNNTRC